MFCNCFFAFGYLSSYVTINQYLLWRYSVDEEVTTDTDKLSRNFYKHKNIPSNQVHTFFFVLVYIETVSISLFLSTEYNT